ncbi:MAG: hypothetical protein HY062_06455 [Bacteroidetes bacterium]|nr:hypothetical protein [Bacteroidota bacterium]
MKPRSYHFFSGFNMLLIMILASFPAISQTVNNSAKCKALAISGAEWAKGSYNFSKESYLSDNPAAVSLNIDSSDYCMRQSVLCLDSCIALASDSDYFALGFARFAKKKATNTLVRINSCKQETRKNRKRELAWEAVTSSQQVVLDAYHASFYFEGDVPVEKKPEVVAPTEKKITKLDVDQALFALLSEQLHEKSEKHKQEISKLNEKIKLSKDPVKTKKYKEEIKKLELQESALVKKNVEASEKLSKINGLIEERDKNIQAGVKSEETVFAKGLNKPADEWNKQVLVNADLPSGLIYQIQIGVYKNTIVPEIFKGLTPIFSVAVPGGISYSTGIFEKFTDAQEAKLYVKSMGLSDAFIIAYHNKKKITLAEAAKLEKK